MLNREIETFLAVVAAGSVNKAARLLNITQSSVSQRLKKLEEDVGSVLIDRRKGGRSIQLTHAGESWFWQRKSDHQGEPNFDHRDQSSTPAVLSCMWLLFLPSFSVSFSL